MRSRLRFSLAMVLLTLFGLLGTLPSQSSALSAKQRAPILQSAENSYSLDQRWRAWDALPFLLKTKVDPRILAELRGDLLPIYLSHPSLLTSKPPAGGKPLEHTRFLVYLRQQPELSALANQVFASAADQRSAYLRLLIAETAAQQTGVKAALDAGMAATEVSTYQPFFIANVLAVEGGLATVIEMAQRDDVAHIMADYPLITFQEESSSLDEVGAAALDPANWNIARVGADRVWEQLHIRGEGAVVAGFDTGVNWKHPALAASYRGRLPNGKVDHNYNWFEPDPNLYPDGNFGPSLTKEPYEACGGHGTHTMGTMVGAGTHPGEQIGMAPGAKWIALPGICYGTMPGGIYDDIGGLKAFQWLLCPTDLSGDLTTADCSKAPDVVNNSWGSANPANEIFRPVIQRLRAAGIAPVFAAGNPWAGAGSIGSPASAPEAISVGAVDIHDTVAPFSGRGPSFFPGEQKPELSAPGVEVLSAVATGYYITVSGTSMAAPHVSGLVALLVSADLRDGHRDLDVDEIEQSMIYSARDLGEPGPDDEYGYGRIDAFAAVNWALSAGDLKGNIRTQGTNAPIAGATITAIDSTGLRFTTSSNATGYYSFSVPSGTYEVTARAWGNEDRITAQQEVLSGSGSLVDFVLTPHTLLTLTGFIHDNRGAVSNALVIVVEHPEQQTHTAGDGSYALSLPLGAHTLQVTAPGHQSRKQVITIAPGTLTQNLILEVAPSILLVEPDAFGGWFYGWPLTALYRTALEEDGYSFDRWPIEDPSVTDIISNSIGGRVYGIPSLATLASYDVVIWAHNGCSLDWGCPYDVLDSILPDYLAGGGRLIYSAQDATLLDGSPLFDQGLHADAVSQSAAGEGDTITGYDFLQGLQLTLTNASLYGFPNGTIAFSPDAVGTQPEDGAAYPVMFYDNNGGAAALAADPCDGGGRAIYLAMGLENVAARGAVGNSQLNELLGRSLPWLQGQRPVQKIVVSSPQQTLTTTPGGVARYEIEVTNAGSGPVSLALALLHNHWPGQIVSSLQPGETSLQLAPCATTSLEVLVTPPVDTALNSADIVTLMLTPNSDATAAEQLALRTVTVQPWQQRQIMPLPTARAAVTAADDHSLYMAGGWEVYNADLLFPLASSAARYDNCRREWTTLSDMPDGRAEAAAATLSGKLYVTGGLGVNTNYYTFSPRASNFVYDPASEQWTTAAPLPKPLAGMAYATMNAKLYLFGGLDEFGNATDEVWVYDPTSDQWQSRAAMPGGARSYASASALGDKIYVVGGEPGLRQVEIYDPATNQWVEGPPLRQGRMSAALVAGSDGALYLFGGANRNVAIDATERLNPSLGQWEPAAPLADRNRNGVSAAYAGGEVIALGGFQATRAETLRLGHSFCLSDKWASNGVIQSGIPTTYTLEVVPEAQPLANVRVVDPLPDGLRFLDFDQNPLGATYNQALRQIEWQGSLPADSPPVQVIYRTELTTTPWTNGDVLPSTVLFSIDETSLFSRTSRSILLSPDFAKSQISADPLQVKSGEMITYSVQIQGTNLLGGALALYDALPADVEYVDASLRYPFGSGEYDSATRAIRWSGEIPSRHLEANAPQYLWGTSDGQGDLPDVKFAWEAIDNIATSVTGYDDEITCDLPIGFAFPYYETHYSDFCLSTNGFLSFLPSADAGPSNDCPMPNPYGNNAVIAAIWDDLIATGGLSYAHLGQAPLRRLVVQWSGVQRIGLPASRLATFQMILYENGLIKIQVRDAGSLSGYTSTTGIEDADGIKGVTYACRTPHSIHDKLAVLFAPSTAGHETATIQFNVQSAAGLKGNTRITNTAIIATPGGGLQRSIATLVNPVDLSASTIQVSRDEVAPYEEVFFIARLQNSGLFTASAIMSMTVPTATTLVDGSLHCTVGICTPNDHLVHWQGTLAPALPVTVTFAVRVTTPLPDRTPITSKITLDDGLGSTYEQTVSFVSRRADLSSSEIKVRPTYVEPGRGATILLLVHNQGGGATRVTLQHSIPAGLTVEEGSLACGIAGCRLEGNEIHWRGQVPSLTMVQVSYRVKVPETAPYGTSYAFAITVGDEDWGDQFNRQATLHVVQLLSLPVVFGPPGGVLYLPLIQSKAMVEEPVPLSLVRR